MARKSKCRIWLNDVEMRPAPKWRRDQAPVRAVGVLAALTPHGIQQLDGEYCQRIRAARGSADRVALLKIRRDVEQDLHLHAHIKKNLYLNIGLVMGEIARACSEEK